MSKVVKKAVNRVKKSFKSLKKFVKKNWKKIAIAAAIVFTAGAFAIVGTGATWGTAFTSIGTTFSAGASALTGGIVGTSAATAAGTGSLGSVALGNAASGALGAKGVAGVAAGGATSGQVVAGLKASAAAGGSSSVVAGGSVFGGNVASVAAGSGGLASGTAGGAASSAGFTTGDALMAKAGLDVFAGYQDNKVEKRERDRLDTLGLYGENRLFEYNGNETPDAGRATPYGGTVRNANLPPDQNAQVGLANPNYNRSVNQVALNPTQSQAPQSQQVQSPVGNGLAMRQPQPARNIDQLVNQRYGRV